VVFPRGYGTFIKNEKSKEVVKMNLADLIAQAGRQRKTIKLKLKATQENSSSEAVEFEPYSSRQLGGKVSFFCLDVQNCTCLNVDLASILDAEITTRSFKPRFPVTF
jgi:hypothetical protein